MNLYQLGLSLATNNKDPDYSSLNKIDINFSLVYKQDEQSGTEWPLHFTESSETWTLQLTALLSLE